MRTRYKILESEPPYFITCTTVAWIPIFTRKPYFDILLSTLNFSRQNKGMKIFAYVILDNHLHLVVAGENLSKTIKEFKSFTAREIVRLAKEEEKGWLLSQLKFHKLVHKAESGYQVWQEGFHPKMITSEEMLAQKIEYIHYNPVRIGIVEKPEDWLYSSARNYLGLPGLLVVDTLEV
jgi:REP element-mobilizing transposase RayT